MSLIHCLAGAVTAAAPIILLGVDTPTLPDPTSSAALGWFVAGIFGIVGILNQSLELWRKLVPKPSPPLHELYATKAEVDALRDALAEEVERITDEVDATTNRMESQFDRWLAEMRAKVATSERDLNDWQRDVEHTLGRLGAQVEKNPRRRQ